MARVRRIMVRLSMPMDEALNHLSERDGLTVSAVAFQQLKAALDRTIHSAAVQDRIAERRAQATLAERLEALADAAEEFKQQKKEIGQ